MIPLIWANQQQTLDLYRRSSIVFDTSDPGTGKTRAALEAFAERRAKGGGCALVLCPKTLMDSAWGGDIQKFVPDLTYRLAYAENRAAAFANYADIYITNTDAARWLCKQKKSFFRRFDTLIIDEISFFKHRTSRRSKAVAMIAKYFRYRAGMTGTPNPNSVSELWHQVFLLDGGERLGKSFFQFRAITQTSSIISPRIRALKWSDKPGVEGAVAKLLQDISIRHAFDECMDIPPNHVTRIDFTLPPKLRSMYREFEDKAILLLEDDEAVGVNAAVVRNKLLQIASGSVYGENQTNLLDLSRYELVLDLIEQREHSVVFFVWTHQREELVRLAKKRGVSYAVIDGSVDIKKRNEIVKAYQAGFFRTLFMHPRTGAYGITLTRGSSTIWASPIYEADLLKQGTHRIYRGGQTKRTETVLVQAKDTVERIVYASLDTKGKKMQSFLDMLKESRRK